MLQCPTVLLSTLVCFFFCLQMIYFYVLVLNFACGFLSLSLQSLYLRSTRRDGERGFLYQR